MNEVPCLSNCGKKKLSCSSFRKWISGPCIALPGFCVPGLNLNITCEREIKSVTCLRNCTWYSSCHLNYTLPNITFSINEDGNQTNDFPIILPTDDSQDRTSLLQNSSVILLVSVILCSLLILVLVLGLVVGFFSRWRAGQKEKIPAGAPKDSLCPCVKSTGERSNSNMNNSNNSVEMNIYDHRT